MKFLRISYPKISQIFGSCFTNALNPAIHNMLRFLIFRYEYTESYLAWVVYMDSLGKCLKNYLVFQMKTSQLILFHKNRCNHWQWLLIFQIAIQILGEPCRVLLTENTHLISINSHIFPCVAITKFWIKSCVVFIDNYVQFGSDLFNTEKLADL